MVTTEGVVAVSTHIRHLVQLWVRPLEEDELKQLIEAGREHEDDEDLLMDRCATHKQYIQLSIYQLHTVVKLQLHNMRTPS